MIENEQYAQADNEVNSLVNTLHDQLQRGRIKDTFNATLNDEGLIVPSCAAPNAKRETMLMMTVRRLATMDKQDDGTLTITLNAAAIQAAVEKNRADAEHAQGEAAKAQAYKQRSDAQEARAAEQRLIEQERAARLRLRQSIRSNF
jgi:hypothetical protein